MDYKFILLSMIIIQIITTYLFIEKNSLLHFIDCETKNIIAIAYINDKIKGSVYFIEDKEKNLVTIKLNLTGLPKNKKLGFHIHATGDLSDGCTSACSHFNPFNTTHGGKGSHKKSEEGIRHVGDLGNITTDKNGNCKMTFNDNMIKLRGYKQNIIGRSIVIHEKTDDLGKGNNSESLRTGNAGKRIACAVIGFAKEMCK
jgi:Cu-Zn family superoxide dismutase